MSPESGSYCQESCVPFLEGAAQRYSFKKTRKVDFSAGCISAGFCDKRVKNCEFEAYLMGSSRLSSKSVIAFGETRNLCSDNLITFKKKIAHTAIHLKLII